MDLDELHHESERINTQVAISEKKLQTFDKVYIIIFPDFSCRNSSSTTYVVVHFIISRRFSSLMLLSSGAFDLIDFNKTYRKASKTTLETLKLIKKQGLAKT